MLDPLTFPNKQKNPTNSLTYTHIFLAKPQCFAQQCILTDSAGGKKTCYTTRNAQNPFWAAIVGNLMGYSEGPSYKDTT